MCLIVFAYNCHAAYRLVLGANRDEYRDRPTIPARFWPDAPHILAGRDQQAGGTSGPVMPGIHGLSNHLFHELSFPICCSLASSGMRLELRTSTLYKNTQ